MTVNAENIYKEAINLNPIDKAELIDRLFKSFLSEKNIEKNELEWKKEVVRRRKAFDNGDIPADTIENVFNRLSKR